MKTFKMVAGQECPLCQCGTIEETATEYKCCGECGNIWDKPESTLQAIANPTSPAKEVSPELAEALAAIPPKA